MNGVDDKEFLPLSTTSLFLQLQFQVIAIRKTKSWFQSPIAWLQQKNLKQNENVKKPILAWNLFGTTVKRKSICSPAIDLDVHRVFMSIIFGGDFSMFWKWDLIEWLLFVAG